MKKRMLSVFVTLCLLVIALVATSPAKQAQATVTWPQQISGIYAGGITAYDEDDFTLQQCGSTQGTYSALRYKDGVTSSPLPSESSTGYTCDGSSSATSADGTYFATKNTGYSHTDLVAYRNGRQLWNTDITYSSNCPSSGSYVNKAANALSMSIGYDGYLYALVTPNEGYSTVCSDMLIKVNTSNGDLAWSVDLGAPGAPGSSPNPVRAWTYDNKIVVMATSNTLREFSYSGVENTSAAYTFPLTSGYSIYDVIANDEGTVFIGAGDGSNSDYSKVLYHKDNGDSGNVTTPYTSARYPKLAATGDGNVAVIYGQNLARIDLATNGVDQITLDTHSGFQTLTSGSVMSYIEDQDGNGLVIRNLYSSNYSSFAVSVDKVSPAGVTTNLFFMSGATDPGTNPTVSPYYKLENGIAAGYLYLPICHEGWDCASIPATSWIHKIALTGFGTPIRDDADRTSYTSQKLNYVAMGDSYSSGEGNPDFNPWTDRSGVNECHRSKDTSYPEWLVQHGGLNLQLTDYVACSGATTDNLLNGGSGGGAWNEPAQVSALSNSTDRVTLTIGGNDIGFVSVATACATSSGWGCSSNTTLNGDLTSRLDALACTTGCTTVDNPDGHAIHSIRSVIDAIATAAPNASIYIAGYPHLFGDSTDNFTENADAPGGASCGGPTGQIFSYTDTQWMNGEVDALNGVIDDAVAGAQGDGIDVTYVSPILFSGHGLCDSGTGWINDIDLTGVYPSFTTDPGSLHPDSDGQTIGYALAFQASM